MSIVTEIITGPSLSDAWLNSVRAVDGLDGRTACHLVTRIVRPGSEEMTIRAAAERLSAELGYPMIETVANTIFPERLARSCRDHHELAHRYRAMYPTVRSLHRANRYGTYFGRIVSYPAVSGSSFDQLADLVRKLQIELGTSGPKSARFELSFVDLTDDRDTGDGSAVETDSLAGLESADTIEQGVEDVLPATPIYVPNQDRSAMGFPCLSFCSFQLVHGFLHLVAHYRRQELVRRGYGNYLGLARLLRYVSKMVNVEPGQLTVVAGVAAVDAARWRIIQLADSVERTKSAECEQNA